MFRGTVLTAACLFVSVASCSSNTTAVAVFSALDREFSEPILDDFELQTGITVRARFDIESTKTVGLVTRIMEEKRPTCDVFWNNEILHTLRLQKQGKLDAYRSPAAANIPANYRSSDGYWYGLAARARVLIVNTDLVEPDRMPDSILDLADSAWQGKVGIAKPLFGTTATHAAVLFSVWGDERGQEYYRNVAANARVLSGNKQVAVAVGRGEIAFGITDTDDAIIELDQGRPVRIIFPDQQAGGLGALFIPNTVCIVKGGPHPEHARRFVDHLLSGDAEARLAQGRSAQFPLNRGVTTSSRVLSNQTVSWMEVDFQAAAEKWEPAMRFLRETFAN